MFKTRKILKRAHHDPQHAGGPDGGVSSPGLGVGKEMEEPPRGGCTEAESWGMMGRGPTARQPG